MIRRSVLFSVLAMFLLLVLLATAQSQQSQTKDSSKPYGLTGKIDYYVSKMDGKKRGYAVCMTSDSPTPKPLIVIIHPGANTEVAPLDLLIAEAGASNLKKYGRECIALRPTGRGPG